MAKKTKSKSRLDKFYKIAKEQGYRSRAAFKLIQLNKKHNFLQNAHVLIDLCAAPGGWLQVASKYMPSDSIIVGIDLDPIKSIPNVRNFQADITTPECITLIKKEIKHLKVDVVLNDGAPNVGSNWAKDAYTQSELVMYALKLATQVLRKNGIFVTKIFRSTDYNNLIWLFNKFFSKVEATKPEASRANSAEIFVVCQGYNAPDIIDPRFFDPQYVFKNSENDLLALQGDNGVNSIKKIFEIKKRRSIKDNTPLTMHRTITLEDFVRSSNPYCVFVDFNRIDTKTPENPAKPDNKSQSLLPKPEEPVDYSLLVPFPEDFAEMCFDLKLLSKKQVASIIKWRAKVLIAFNTLKKAKKAPAPDAELAKDEGMEVESVEAPEEEYSKVKKEERAERKLKEKQLLKYVKNKLINDTEVVGGEVEGELGGFEFTDYADQIRKGRYIDIDAEERVDADHYIDPKDKKRKKLNSFNEMSDNIEYLYEQRRKKTEAKTAPQPAPSNELVSMIKSKREALKDQKRAEKTIFDTSKAQTGGSNSAKPTENAEPEKVNIERLQQNSKWFGKKIFDILKDQSNDIKLAPQTQPGRPERPVTHQTLDDFSSDSEDEGPQKAKPAPKTARRAEPADEELNELLEDSGPYNLDKMTDDDLAEMLALSRKMLRKKNRREIVDSAYNRYNFPEEPSQLPSWFYEDEKRHSGGVPQVSKEEIAAEKERLMLMRNTLPKKVMEAKYRKKKRVLNTMKRASSEVAEVYDTEGLSPFSKARAISQIYKKAIRKTKSKPKAIVVAKRHTSGAPRKKSGRKFKVVDRRLKKDLRSQSFKKRKLKNHSRR